MWLSEYVGKGNRLSEVYEGNVTDKKLTLSFFGIIGSSCELLRTWWLYSRQSALRAAFHNSKALRNVLEAAVSPGREHRLVLEIE